MNERKENKIKMKKSKTQKGITLIALIITIVVLLILAAVAISSITNDGILSYAQNAAKDYNQAVKDEQDMLSYYEKYLGGKIWRQNGTTVTNGTTTLIVGDKITNYDESTKADGTTISGLTNVEWKVLGAENGKILLFSTDDVKSSHTLSGIEGYYNGVEELNTICADYGKGKFAESARTVTIEDINRVTGYDPTATGDGNPYGKGEVYEYGNEVTYTLTKDAEGTVTGIAWTSAANSSSTTGYTKFMSLDGKRMMSDADWEAITDKTGLTRVNSVTLTSNYYHYYPNTLTTNDSGITKGITTDSAAYLMLFKEVTDTSTNTSYRLGSSFVNTYMGHVGFGLRGVYNGYIGYYGLWDTNDGANYGEYGVRAVVTLESDVKLTSAGTNSWTLSK